LWMAAQGGHDVWGRHDRIRAIAKAIMARTAACGRA
jgi:hypothetical protein